MPAHAGAACRSPRPRPKPDAPGVSPRQAVGGCVQAVRTLGRQVARLVQNEHVRVAVQHGLPQHVHVGRVRLERVAPSARVARAGGRRLHERRQLHDVAGPQGRVQVGVPAVDADLRPPAPPARQREVSTGRRPRTRTKKDAGAYQPLPDEAVHEGVCQSLLAQVAVQPHAVVGRAHRVRHPRRPRCGCLGRCRSRGVAAAAPGRHCPAWWPRRGGACGRQGGWWPRPPEPGAGASQRLPRRQSHERRHCDEGRRQEGASGR